VERRITNLLRKCLTEENALGALNSPQSPFYKGGRESGSLVEFDQR
jgi:hypothetical protein